MILNTKNGIYNEVWHSCPYSTRNDKPSKTMLSISSPPGLIRVKEKCHTVPHLEKAFPSKAINPNQAGGGGEIRNIVFDGLSFRGE